MITDRRVFVEPSSPEQAWQTVDDLLAAPATMRLLPGARHWDLFRQLTEDIDARGNYIFDSYLAAYAMENNATWLSADRGFARFKRLRWAHPLDN